MDNTETSTAQSQKGIEVFLAMMELLISQVRLKDLQSTYQPISIALLPEL